MSPLASITLPPSRSGIWMTIWALPGVRFSCASTSWSKALMRALDLAWRALGELPDPFQLVVDRFLAALLLALFLLEPLGLLLQIGGVIAFVDEVAPAIELEDPVDDIVEEIAVVGDEDDVARIVDQMLLEPLDAFGVEVVGRLVEQQDVGLFEQQPGQRDAALLAAREVVDRASPGRAAQRVHRDLELVVERPAVDRVDLLLELAHLGHQRVEIARRGSPIMRLIALKRSIMSATGRTPSLTFSMHRLGGVELRLLLEIADA